jgi:F-type H+-transporting ATPase subunit epsilon
MANQDQNTIHLEVITQEKHVLTKEVRQLTAPGSMGEVTILPKHIPLFTRLQDGVITIYTKSGVEELAILGGFMDVGPLSRVTILADAAINASDINLAKAEAAKRRAEDAMKQKVSEVEFRQAEASLRRALLELKVARRRRRQEIPTE